jgi:hypothetical protein
MDGFLLKAFVNIELLEATALKGVQFPTNNNINIAAARNSELEATLEPFFSFIG